MEQELFGGREALGSAVVRSPTMLRMDVGKVCAWGLCSVACCGSLCWWTTKQPHMLRMDVGKVCGWGLCSTLLSMLLSPFVDLGGPLSP